MPERFIEERFDKLQGAVDQAASELAADRVARDEHRKAEEHRTKWWRFLTVVAAVAGPVGLVVGVVGVTVGSKAQSAIDASNEVRNTARVSSCEQAVDFAQAHNELVARSQDLLLAVAAGSTNPETQSFVAEQVALYEENIVPVRDCSPDGLTAFAEGTGGYLP